MKIQFEGYAFRFGWLSWLIALAALLALVINQLPVNWVSAHIAEKTACKVMLVQPTGTIWEGSASFGFSEVKIGELKTCSAPYGMTERFSWESYCSLVDLQCKWNIQHSNLERPLELAVTKNGLTISANQAELPGNFLEGFGSPWNSLHPRGKLKLQWSDIKWESIPTGMIEIQFLDITSPISLIKPLGSYAIKLQVDQDVKIDLFTLSGPLLLNGKGLIANGRLSFQGDASALPESRDSLIGLLSIIGRKDGSVYRLKM
jgi:general secretion pathway protein N